MLVMDNYPNNRWIYTYDYAPDEIWAEWRVSTETPSWVLLEAQAVSCRIESVKSVNPLSFYYVDYEDLKLIFIDSSFNHYSVQKVKEYEPAAKTALLCGEGMLVTGEQCEKIQGIRTPYPDLSTP